MHYYFLQSKKNQIKKCQKYERKKSYDLQVFWRDCLMKTNPYVAVHCWKALSLSSVHSPLKIILVKGPVRKLHLKFSAFTAHLHLKVLSFSRVKSSACSILWKNCIFANTFCIWRQIHVKTLISICPTMFFQRLQHRWTHTLKEQCSHLNFSWILPCKTLSKYGAHRKKRPGRYQFFTHFTLK